MAKSKEILDLDAYLEQMAAEEKSKKKGVPRETDRTQDMQKVHNTLDKYHGQKSQEKEEKDTYKYVQGSRNYLPRLASQTLDRFIHNHPKGKQLIQQVKTIKNAIKEYRRLGNDEAVENCKRKLEQLEGDYKKLVSLSKRETAEERKENIEKANSNPEVQEYTKEINTLKNKLRFEQPASLVKRLEELRKTLRNVRKASGTKDEEIEDLDDISTENVDDIENLEDVDTFNYFDTEDEISFSMLNKMKPSDAYIKLCEIIADKIDYTPEEVNRMKASEIKKQLNLVKDDDLIQEIKDKIDEVQAKKSSLIHQLSGRNDITDVLFSMFGYKEENPQVEAETKNILAANNIPYVIGIANNVCLKLSMTEHIDDAISYGLLELSKCINRWFKVQKAFDTPVTFTGFMGKAVYMAINRGLFDLTSYGTVSGSSRMDKHHKNNKRFNEMKAENPNLSDELINDILAEEEVSLMNISTASEVQTAIGGEDADDIDYTNFENRSGKDADNIAETRMISDQLLENISKLFNEFDVDKNGNPINSKVFDKYDCLLFRMYTGIDMTVDENTGKPRKYNQEEIAKKLLELYRENGDSSKTMSASAVSTRIQTLFGNKELYEKNQKEWEEYNAGLCQKKPAERKRVYGKLEKLLNRKKDLKAAFERICEYIASNPESFRLVSNENEGKLNDVLSLENFNNADAEDKINNNSVNLDLVLGDTQDFDEDDFLSKFDKMIDFTGLK